MPFLSPTTRMPQGFTNASQDETLGQAGHPDPTWAAMDYDDFMNYVSTNYTNTVVGTGTVANVDAEGGAIALATSAGATDAVYMQGRSAWVKLSSPEHAFFKFAGTLSEVVNCAFHAGLIIPSTTPQAAADGLWIFKAAGAATLVLRHRIGGVTTDTALPAAAGTLTAGVAFELGFHSDEQGNVEVFFNPGTGTQVIRPDLGQARGRVATMPALASGLTTALLAPSWGLLNASAVARTLTADYFVASRNR